MESEKKNSCSELSPDDTLSSDFGFDLSFTALQNLELKTVFSVPIENSNHLCCCPSSKHVYVAVGNSLFVQSNNKTVFTQNFERNLNCISCCETYQCESIANDDDDDDASRLELFSAVDDIGNLHVINVNNKEMISVNITGLQEQGVHSVQMASSRKSSDIRIMIASRVGSIFVSPLFQPVINDKLVVPAFEDFSEFNLIDEDCYVDAVPAFCASFVDIDCGDILSVVSNLGDFYIRMWSPIKRFNFSEETKETYTSVIEGSCADVVEVRPSLQSRVNFFIADLNDCRRLVILNHGLITIWNMENMSLESVFDCGSDDQVILDMTLSQSHVVLLIQKGNISSTINFSMEIRSFPCLSLKKKIQIGNYNSETLCAMCYPCVNFHSNHHDVDESIYFLAGWKEIKMFSLEQADVASRVLRLAAKGKFSSAEKLASVFGIDPVPAFQTKLNFCLNMLNTLQRSHSFQMSQKSGLESDPMYKKTMKDLFNCLKIVDVSKSNMEQVLALVLPTLFDSMQVLVESEVQLKKLSHNIGENEINALKLRFHNVVQRLGTYVIVSGQFNFQDWKSFLKLPAKDLFVKFVSKGWLDTADIIWQRHKGEILSCETTTDRTKISKDSRGLDMNYILSCIPKNISSRVITKFINNLVIPEAVFDLDSIKEVAHWIEATARQLEVLEPHAWPENAISLCSVFEFEENCNIMDSCGGNTDYMYFFHELAARVCHISPIINYTHGDDYCLIRIRSLLVALRNVQELKSKYSCTFPLAIVEVEDTESIAFRMLDRVVALELIECVMKDVIKPFLLGKKLNVDEVLLKYIEKKSHADVGSVIDPCEEKIVHLIRSIEAFSMKCQAVTHLVRFVSVPWNGAVKQLVKEILPSNHPSVRPIREKFHAVSLGMTLSNYGMLRHSLYYMDAEQVVRRIVQFDEQQCCIMDALRVAKDGGCSPADVFFYRCECLCSRGRNGEVMELTGNLNSFVDMFTDEFEDKFVEDAVNCGEDVENQMIELCRLNASSRFLSTETRTHFYQCGYELISSRMEKNRYNSEADVSSFDDNFELYESLRCELAKSAVDILSIDDTFVSNDLFKHADSKDEEDDYYELFLKQCHSNDINTEYMLSLSDTIKRLSKNLPNCTVEDIENILSKHRILRLALNIFEASLPISTYDAMQNELETMLGSPSISGRLSLCWSDLSYLVACAIREFSFRRNHIEDDCKEIFDNLVNILACNKQDLLIMQTSNVLFFDSFHTDLGLSLVSDNLKTSVTSFIDTFFSSSLHHGLALSLLFSYFSEESAINKLGQSFQSTNVRFKKQKAISTVALAYAGLRHLDKKFFFTGLATSSNWGYKLAKYKINFNNSSKSESISPMAVCSSIGVQMIFQFCKDFDLSPEEMNLTCIRTLLAQTQKSPPNQVPSILSRASIFCCEALMMTSTRDKLLALLQECLTLTDGRDYETIEFILQRSRELEQLVILKNDGFRPSSDNKLGLLNFLKTYKSIRSKKKQDSQESSYPRSMTSRKCQPEDSKKDTRRRLSFHAFFSKEMIETVSAELNKDTVDEWRSAAAFLKLSEDDIIMTAIRNIITEEVEWTKKSGDLLSPDIISLLMTLNSSISDPCKAVQTAVWMVDTLPEVLLKHKSQLCAFTASLCKPWMESEAVKSSEEKSRKAARVYSNYCFEFKKLSAMEILVEKGFEDLAKLVDKELPTNVDACSSFAEKVVMKLYEHPTIEQVWKMEKHFTSENCNVQETVEFLVQIFDLNLIKIQMDLIYQLMPSSSQLQQELANASIYDVVHYQMIDPVDDDHEKRLLYAAYLLCHMEFNKVIPILQTIIKDGDRPAGCRLRAVRCLLKLVSPAYAASQLGHPSTSALAQFVTILIAALHLEQLGLLDNVESFSRLDKSSLVRTLITQSDLQGQRRLPSGKVAILSAGLAVSFGVYDAKLIDKIAQLLVKNEKFFVVSSFFQRLMNLPGMPTREWYQESIISLVTKLLEGDCGNPNTVLKAFNSLLYYPGCFLMRITNGSDAFQGCITNWVNKFCQKNMEPCAFLIGLLCQDVPACYVSIKTFLNEACALKVLSRLEEMEKNGFQVPLGDVIKHSAKRLAGLPTDEVDLLQIDYSAEKLASALNHSIWGDLSMTNYFQNHATFQECQSVLDITVMNATLYKT